jgi:hypothetical protein
MHITLKGRVAIRFIVVVKKTFRYSNVFFYNHLYHPECIYEKRYKMLTYCVYAPLLNRIGALPLSVIYYFLR